MPAASYNSLTDADIAFLQRTVAPDGEVLRGDAIHADYSHDEMGALHRAPDSTLR